jgi:hypothetical protein
MSKLAKALTAAAGNAGESLYVEDVFSTYLYTGNGTSQTITNGIDLDGEGGLVWLQGRTSATGSRLDDTERPLNDHLRTFSTEAPLTYSVFSSLNSNGFSLVDSNMNSSGADYVSWTFRKAEKFFDVVTYTGDGVAGRTVAHNLGSIPACMIVKRTNAAQGWAVYHVGMDATNPENWMMRLNATNARFDLTPSRWNDTAPTSTEFTLSDNDEVNGSGDTYVAYLFASDAGGFGDDGSESIIKCGSFTADGSGNATIDLGFEPQWVLAKGTDDSSNWFLRDNMRGMPVSGTSAPLFPNTSASEGSSSVFSLNSTGFSYSGLGYNTNHIYIVIRRPMKTPESGTEVFTPVVQNASANAVVNSGFPVDLNVSAQRDRASFPFTLFIDRLRGTSLSSSAKLASSSTNAEANFSSGGGFNFASNTNIVDGLWNSQYAATSSMIYYNFKRATGFFDVVAYTGTGVARTVNHNLAAVPDLMIFKQRDIGGYWMVYPVQLGNKYLVLQLTNAVANGFTGLWNNASPTASTFPLGTGGDCNQNGGTYVAYLFATLAGVSKVGSYTGTAADLNVDCGFSAGARFILIKRTDSTGDWYVWDSERGIAAGNDPYLLLNSTAAEVTSTDYIDPLSSGFTVTSSAPAALNASGGTYIFLAIA